MERYEVSFGPNTKQLWIYDNDKEVFIDPPLEVLYKLDEDFGKEWSQEKEEELLKIVNEKPDWLFEEEYWYDDDIDI